MPAVEVDVWSTSNTAVDSQTLGAQTHNLQCDSTAEGRSGRETTVPKCKV